MANWLKNLRTWKCKPQIPTTLHRATIRRLVVNIPTINQFNYFHTMPECVLFIVITHFITCTFFILNDQIQIKSNQHIEYTIAGKNPNKISFIFNERVNALHKHISVEQNAIWNVKLLIPTKYIRNFREKKQSVCFHFPLQFIVVVVFYFYCCCCCRYFSKVCRRFC